MNDKKKKLRELFLYVLFGALTTLVNFVVYFLCQHLLGEGMYLVSNVAAWILAVAFAYVTNKLWVFESKSWKRDTVLGEIGKFVAARLFSLGLEEAGLYLMIDRMAFDSWSISLMGHAIGGGVLAKLAMQVMVVILNYVFSKLLIFRRKGKHA